MRFRRRSFMDMDLRADCSRCAALCCVALAFDRSEDFAFDKPAGVPCPNLDGNVCKIHDHLEEAGCRGCAHYECFGAGQRVTAMAPDHRDLDAFRRMRDVHELCVILREWPWTLEHLAAFERSGLADRIRAFLRTLVDGRRRSLQV